MCSREVASNAVDQAVYNNTADDLNDIFKTSQIVRKELLNVENWCFEGSFDNFDIPKHLSLLLRWILIGPNKQLTNESRNDQVNKDGCKNNYEAKPGSTRSSATPETPLSVGLGLYMYHKTPSSTILDILSNLRLSISYKKICKIKDELVETAKAPNISVNKPLYFAMDIDLQINMPDGKNQLHSVTQVIFQEKDTEWNIENKYISRSSQTSTKKR